MHIPEHPRTQVLDGRLPALDQQREGFGVVLHLHAPHRLLVGDRKKGEKLHAPALLIAFRATMFIRSVM